MGALNIPWALSRALSLIFPAYLLRSSSHFTDKPAVAGRSFHKYKWNIYSKTMQEFLWEKDLENQTASISVPDGEYELYLYQTASSGKSTLHPPHHETAIVDHAEILVSAVRV